ncbi:MAG: PP2C family protein-serine/threonine phosphatase [Nitrososphaerales archaeon]
MVSSVRFDAFSASNSIGIHHPENQDSYLADDCNFLFAVADGVGGYAGAKEASSLAIERLKTNASTINNESSLRDCISQIHSEIQQRARKLGFENMGTTLAVAKIVPEKRYAILGNVGDSPIIIFKGRKSAAEPVFHDDSHRSHDPTSTYGIIQYLGLECDLDIHTRMIKYDGSVVLLLCSDGITDNLLLNSSDKRLLLSLVASGSAEKIVKRAIEEGFKPDDMTAILVFL